MQECKIRVTSEVRQAVKVVAAKLNTTMGDVISMGLHLLEQDLERNSEVKNEI